MSQLKIVPPLGPKELNAAVVGLINNSDGCLISLEEFKNSLPISFRNKQFVIDWLIGKGYLESAIVEECGTVKNAIFVAWTKAGVKLKRKHTQDIEKELKDVNEGKSV